MSGSDLALDTNALSAFLMGDQQIGRIVATARNVYLPIIVVGEFRFGILNSKLAEHNRRRFDRFLKDVTVLGVDEGAAEQYASIRYQLKTLGRPIPDNDIWIAAIALHHGLPLLSKDAHFRQVEGLDLRVW